MAARQIDAATLQAILTRVAEATEAASSVAQMVGTQASAASSPQPTSRLSSTTDWSKLLSKPAVLDCKSQEEEIRCFRDWSWQLRQYLCAIDEGFNKDLNDLEDDPSKAMDMSSASDDVRTRGTRLYGLLAGLVKNRALQIVKAVSAGDGYEAYRQLLLALKPTSKARGLALIGAATSWGQFNMQQALQPQLLKLEEVFEEARRAGTALQEELKVAVVLKAVSGQLKTHLNLNLTDTITYSELREAVLKWDKAQQRWSHLVVDDGGVLPMEIDRIKGKGKGKEEKGKGKSKDGKSKCKGKDSKGYGYGGKSFDSKGGKGRGKQHDKGKGKSEQKSGKGCWKCGRPGHLQKDCWQSGNVRNVQEDAPSQASYGTAASSHPPSGTASFAQSSTLDRNVSQTVGNQSKISRITLNSSSISPSTENEALVFDLRPSVSTQEPCVPGGVRVIYHYIGDEDDAWENNNVRVTQEPTTSWDEDDFTTILIDSGADSAVFPVSWSQAGQPVGGQQKTLHDAQGRRIPTQGVRDVEVHLMDVQGRPVILKERVMLSSSVTQPILCFGHLLEQGWSISAVDNTLVHSSNLRIPLDLQNKSIVVSGRIRVIREECHSIRVMTAILGESLLKLPHGWSDSASGFKLGWHIDDKLQDPSLGYPLLDSGRRTTLVEMSPDNWELVEFCENLQNLDKLDTSFEELLQQGGNRSIVTIVTDNAESPEAMDFFVEDDFGILSRHDEAQTPFDEVPLAPDESHLGEALEVIDEGVGPHEVVELRGSADARAAPEEEDRVVLSAFNPDRLVVNEVEVRASSTLAVLRAACRFHNLSTSGSKLKCYRRLVNHLQKMELDAAREAAHGSEVVLHREPNAVSVAQLPDEETQRKHQLTHVPYAPWCESCIAFRARPDRRERDDSARVTGVPCVSLDFCYTRAHGDDQVPQDVVSALWLVMVCSHGGFVGCIPLKSKSQINLIAREVMNFIQLLGHHDVVLQADNEGATRQILRVVVSARHKLGLPTRSTTSKVGDHSNALVENAIGRIRALAGSLMDHVQKKLNTKFSSSHGLWSWAGRHACWILNRFQTARGLTPYELLFQKPYGGRLAEFAEPVYAFVKTSRKGEARWCKALFLGKTDAQDSYLVHNGTHLLLSRSIRRVSRDWRSSLAHYLHFDCHSWQYQSGFGARIIPAKQHPVTLHAGAGMPPILEVADSKFDAEAEAVQAKARELEREETEQKRMILQDKPTEAGFASADVEDEVYTPSVAPADDQLELPPGQSPSKRARTDAGAVQPPPQVEVDDENIVQQEDVSDDTLLADLLPRPSKGISSSSTSTRPLEVEAPEEEQNPGKKMRPEERKKARIMMLKNSMEDSIRTVSFGTETFYTVDESDYELEEEDFDDFGGDVGFDLYYTANSVSIPDELWSDAPLDQKLPDPSSDVERVADELEVHRLVSMGVLSSKLDDGITNSLTTRFVRDWRIKNYGEHSQGGEPTKRWLRRSRLVAREYAFREKRMDCFSPATSVHTLRILPCIYLSHVAEEVDGLCPPGREWTFGTFDIKDAFLQVPQEKPMKVALNGSEYQVLRNLPGQRIGAKAWFSHFQKYLSDELGFSFCPECPCLGRKVEALVLIHVDDVMFTGDSCYVSKVLIPTLQKKFELSVAMLDKVGDSLTFLKRSYTKVEGGMTITPGGYADAMINAFETEKGLIKRQQVPCDSSFQMEDTTSSLNSRDASLYRSVTGMGIYLSQERADLCFAVKELASKMSKPTELALQRMRKFLGYVKATKDYAVRLFLPVRGRGFWKQSEDKQWILEGFSDSDWAGDRTSRRSTSCGVHLLNNIPLLCTSRSQKIVALSSCEAELHALTSTMADHIYLRRCIEFALGMSIAAFSILDSSSARQLASRKGVGKVKHMSGRLLWVQDYVAHEETSLVQIPSAFNLADIGTKPLPGHRIRMLLYHLGFVMLPDLVPVGEQEAQNFREKKSAALRVNKLAKTILQLAVFSGLEPLAHGFEHTEGCEVPVVSSIGFGQAHSTGMFFLVFMIAFVGLLLVVFALKREVTQVTNQLSDLTARVQTLGTELKDLVDTQHYANQSMCSLHYGLVELGGFIRHEYVATLESVQAMDRVQIANREEYDRIGSTRYLFQRRIRAPAEQVHVPAEHHLSENTDQLASSSAWSEPDFSEERRHMERVAHELEERIEHAMITGDHEAAEGWQSQLDEVQTLRMMIGDWNG